MNTKFIESHRSDETIKHPFPSMRPDVKIVESSEKISEVDCPELQWWFAVPQMGESYLWANYNGETMELESVTEMTPITAAHIHGIDCVELQVREWSLPGWPDSPHLFYAALDDTHSRWISVVDIVDEKKIFYTINDEAFEEQWAV